MIIIDYRIILKLLLNQAYHISIIDIMLCEIIKMALVVSVNVKLLQVNGIKSKPDNDDKNIASKAVIHAMYLATIFFIILMKFNCCVYI